MDRGNERQDMDNTKPGSIEGGSATNDYGGMGRNFDQVDLNAANEVGADPPGGLPLDIAGGRQGLDESEAEQ